MTHHWGRTDAAGVWPNRRPLWTLGLLLIAIASGKASGTDLAMAMDTEQAGRGHRSDKLRIGKCSVGSRLRSLRSPLRGLDPTSALPRSGVCRSGDRLWSRERTLQREELAGNRTCAY